MRFVLGLHMLRNSCGAANSGQLATYVSTVGQHVTEDVIKSNTVFGDPEGLLQRFFRVINEFQGGKKTGVIK